MTASLLALLLLQSSPPAAQPAEPVPAATAEGAKVVPYPASYFAQFRPDTALDMLNRLPGFTLDGGTGARGFSGSEGNVRLDGQLPPSRGDNMTAILRRIPASSIERIDLVTGGAGGIDMQGQAVIANVIRRAGGGLQTTLTAGGTVYTEADAAPTLRLEMQKSQGGKLLEGILIYNEEPFGGIGPRVRQSFAVPPAAPSVTTTPSRFDSRTLNENARISGAYETPILGGSVRVNGTFGQTDGLTRTFDEPTNGAAPSNEQSRQIHQIAEAGGRYSRRIGGATVEGSLFHFYRRIDTDSTFSQASGDQRFYAKNRSGEDIARTVVRLPRRGAWTFDGGAEVAYNWLDSQSDLFFNGAPSPLTNSDVEVEELRTEAFATAVWVLNPRLNLQMGLRVEHSTISTEAGTAQLEKSLTYVKPRLLATWTPAEGHLAVLRIERTIDQLPFSDFSASASLLNGQIVSGNPDLVPAENLIVEGRYEYRFAGRGAFVLAYTHYDIENVIGRRLFPVQIIEDVNGVPTPRTILNEAADNIGSGTRQSVIVRLTAPLEGLGLPGGLLRLSHTWWTSEIVDPTTGTPRVFSNETPWDWTIGLSQEIPNSKWRWGVDAYGFGFATTFLPREISTGASRDNYALYVEYRASPKLTIRFDGLNVTDRENLFLRQRYAGDRSSGIVNFREVRETRGLNGGAGYRLTVRKTL